MTAKLPEFPKIDPEQRGKSFRQQVTEWNEVTGAMNRYYNNECCYFADDADAMVAALRERLKVAVEALLSMQYLRCTTIDNAIALIGPLPPEGG